MEQVNAKINEKKEELKQVFYIYKVNHDLNSKERNYQCPFATCNRIYEHKNKMFSHLRTHYGIKPFACSFCGKTFNEKGNLKTHLRIHTGERPYKCTKCTKAFKAFGQLKDHMISHTGIRPFSCKFCQKVFRRKGILKKHLESHSNNKIFETEVDGKENSQKLFALKNSYENQETTAKTKKTHRTTQGKKTKKILVSTMKKSKNTEKSPKSQEEENSTIPKVPPKPLQSQPQNSYTQSAFQTFSFPDQLQAMQSQFPMGNIFQSSLGILPHPAPFPGLPFAQYVPGQSPSQNMQIAQQTPFPYMSPMMPFPGDFFRTAASAQCSENYMKQTQSLTQLTQSALFPPVFLKKNDIFSDVAYECAEGEFTFIGDEGMDSGFPERLGKLYKRSLDSEGNQSLETGSAMSGCEGEEHFPYREMEEKEEFLNSMIIPSSQMNDKDLCNGFEPIKFSLIEEQINDINK